MERTQIYLSREQTDALDREAKRLGTTRSHLIREAIAERYGAAKDRERIAQALRESAGAWADRHEDGKAYVERLRTGRRWRELYPDWGSEAEADAEADAEAQAEAEADGDEAG